MWPDEQGHEGGVATPTWPEAQDGASVDTDVAGSGRSRACHADVARTAEGAPASLTWLDDNSHEGGSVTPMWPEAQEVGPVAPTWPDAQEVRSVTSTWPAAYEGGPATPPVDEAAAVAGETSPAVSPSEQAILDELEAWLASLKR